MLLWSGQALSDIGGAVSELAFPLLALAVTHSPALAGFAAALRALPATLFSLFAGVLVDRWNRKSVMLVCDTGRALSLVSMGLVTGDYDYRDGDPTGAPRTVSLHVNFLLKQAFYNNEEAFFA